MRETARKALIGGFFQSVWASVLFHLGVPGLIGAWLLGLAAAIAVKWQGVPLGVAFLIFLVAGIFLTIAFLLLVIVSIKAWRALFPRDDFMATHAAALAQSITDEVQKASAVSAEAAYMTAYEALHYMADESEWGEQIRNERVENRIAPQSPMLKQPLLEAFGEFKRVAESGHIAAFGRKNGVGDPQSIPSIYWTTAIIHSACMHNPSISETMPSAPNPDGISSYKNLRIQRADVQNAWPKPAILSRRISVVDLLTQAETDGWVFSGKKWALYRFHKALQEAALNGDVAVWGRRLKRGWDLVSAVRIYPIEPIDAVFFREHWIDVHQAWMHKENAFVVTSRPAQIEPEFYSDLHVDRSQASAWLHGEARHVRQQVEKNPSN